MDDAVDKDENVNNVNNVNNDGKSPAETVASNTNSPVRIH
jgi:hypothetical protein